MAVFCTNCGSEHHFTFDCTKPKRAEPLKLPEEPAEPMLETLAAIDALVAEAEQPPLLPPPDWCPWGPQVCSKTRLWAFRDDKELAAFTHRIGPEGWKTDRKWTCEHCGLTHVRRHLDYATSGGSEYGKAPPFDDPAMPAPLRKRPWTPWVSPATKKKMAERDALAAGALLNHASRLPPRDLDAEDKAKRAERDAEKKVDALRPKPLKRGGPQGSLF